ncbi:helix-turn-helix domain-containing protein [Fusobacterium polymorphum]|uniref:Transcriptional regulator n=1 Tax=Fusobacterium nucleatum subsp. polymorphum TaxID=76857 RepID=A0A2C6CAZ1_FUSNP|nr:helix-turn-helix domain-containing protein [Fusobacterium polymorphum]PHI13613.1 transcriptional regulator [Fusobacterium polymorphum]
MENKISRKKNPPTKKEIELANRLRTKRLENNLSLQEVADKLGISKVTVSRYETLDITNIPSDKIEGMAELYNTTPAYLMGWGDTLINNDSSNNLDEELKIVARDYEDLSDEKKKLFNSMMKNFMKTLKETE